ncbi:MAG: sugar-transfer associated ATP-grasp domain-containing protein [Cyclonatronaceae bacterium]
MSSFVKSSLKTLARFTKGYLHEGYHEKHAREATGILKAIEHQRGKIRNQDKKRCDDYATEVLGHIHFAPWLYVYTVIAGQFKEGWIPDNYYGSVVVPKLKGEYGKMSSLNALNTVLFQSKSFPDVLFYANGIFFDNEYQFVPLEDAESIIFGDQDRAVFKLDLSLRGRGIHIIKRDRFSVDYIQKLGNGVFQRYIKQHGVFEKFAIDSVATLRVTTVFQDNGEVSARASHLRFGTGDDAYVKSRTNIRLPIDLETGAFHDAGYTVDWNETKTHPTSNVEFAGNRIPNFKTCIATVRKLHRKVPFVRCVGWDISVDFEEHVQVMEWNGGHNGIKFTEATQGPCFADLGWEHLAPTP